MALRKWDEAADLLMIDIPGLEWPAARLALVRAARKFYERSLAWREVCEPLLTAEGIADYDMLDIPHAEVVAVREVYIGTRRIHDDEILAPADFRRLARERPHQGMPFKATWDSGMLWLYPTPIASGIPLAATLACRPTHGAPGIPAQQWEDHIDAIVLGARELLHRSPGKPWTSADDAMLCGAEFQRQIEDWQVKARLQGTDAQRRVTAYYF